ncbi:T9SS type A sorting domain-containing protein [Polaribacter uvawellassae]|uniref:T9SS type A sorting domain-containing protein n=1 Tax=Polaribacter uvawellassae TaxID=3133495 RepID=UPI00321B0EE7
MVKKLLFILFLCFSTAVFSQKTLQKLAAAPNPFFSKTTIQFNTTKNQTVFLVVKNVLGKTVFSKTYSTKKGINKITFNRDNLQSGMYIYAIRSSNEMVSKRFVIK